MRKDALVDMGTATTTNLTLQQLRELANDPAATLAHLDAVLASLSSVDEELVNWACESLENCGTPPVQSLPMLQKLIATDNVPVAIWACKLAGRLEHDAAAAEPQLALAIQATKPQLLREEAARVLGMIGPLSADTTNLLEQAAKDGSPRLKRLASAALGR